MKKFLERRRGPERFAIEGPWSVNDPVHENLCYAALYQVRTELGLADANFSKLWDDVNLNEFLRGVFWNDDPEVLMFDANDSSDADFSSGVLWLDHFTDAEGTSQIDYKNMTGRSHFWDMQFMHGMACTSDEAAALTSYRALMWAELMYKVAIGESVTDSGLPSSPAEVVETVIIFVKIPANPTSYDKSGKITESIAKYFSTSSVPNNTDSLEFLLARDDPFRKIDYGKRAIGSVMHLIQDSFARGHTRRVLLNPEDLVTDSVTAMTFTPGEYGKFGDVITFHNYVGQDSDQHDAFDEDTSTDGLDPTDLSTFNEITGGRDAIDRCQKLLTHYACKTPWEKGPMQLLQDIFKLAPNATGADSNVNLVPIQVVVNTGAGAPVGTADPRYQAGTGPAYVVQKNSAWVSPPAGAAWISIATNTQGRDQSYAYRIELTLPSTAVASTTVLTGRAAADNQITSIRVNNTTVYGPFGTYLGGGQLPGPGYTAFLPFTIETNSFRVGSNTIDFLVRNDGGPTGLIVIFDTQLAVLKE
jgi:hypothetical protein